MTTAGDPQRDDAARLDVGRRLDRFIRDELLEESLDGDDPLAVGAVDSLGIEQLIEYAEGEFGVRIAEEEATRENFESVAALAGLIASKRGVR